MDAGGGVPLSPEPDEAGFTTADLATIRRELFMDALGVARQDHDPASEWEAFCEAAWREAGLAFGFLPRAAPAEEGPAHHPPGGSVS